MLKNNYIELLKSNPWITAKEVWQESLCWPISDRPKYVLTEDLKAIDEFNNNEDQLIQNAKDKKKKRDKYVKIITDLLPQPFIGNPQTAKFWIIGLNPGFSDQDYTDMVNGENDGFATDKKDRDVRLAMRQKDILEALTLNPVPECDSQTQKPIHSFYVLKEHFRTSNKKAKEKKGTYNWWLNALLGNDKNKTRQAQKDIEESLFTPCCRGDKKLLSCFFATEIFPYHSKDFGYTKNLYETAHFKFLQKLLKWGESNEKVFLIRSISRFREMLTHFDNEYKLSDDFLHSDRILCSISARRFVISENAFVPYKAILETPQIFRELINK